MSEVWRTTRMVRRLMLGGFNNPSSLASKLLLASLRRSKPIRLRPATGKIRHGPSDENASIMSGLSARMVMRNAVRLPRNPRMRPTGRSGEEPRRAAPFKECC